MAHESQPLSLNNASVPHLPRVRAGSLVAVCALCIYYLSIIYTHPADIHRVLYHITYALGAHTIACTGCPGVDTRAVSELVGFSMNYNKVDLTPSVIIDSRKFLLIAA